MCYNILVQTTVVISIIAPLFIMMQVKQPEDFVGQMGDLIQFGIEARGEGLTYQWQVSGPDGTYWNDSAAGGYNTPQIYGFDITEARIGNLYRCKVTDSAGNVVYSEPGEIVLLSETWSYRYNADGLRTSRSNGATTYNYIYNGSSLSQMTVGGNTLYFAYDASGSPMSVTYNGTNYYYATNLQGDITAILTIGGSAVVRYTYDAWGKLLSTTGSMAETLGEINPLRYRGYVYDIETGLYYLQSRYYDPEMGRFINADVTVYTGQGFIGCNMYAYCINNPTNHFDSKGTDAVWIQEKDTVPLAGHTGLLVEDEEEDTWYFFYWGMDSESIDFINVIKALMGTNAKLVWKEIDADDFDLTTTAGVKKALQMSDDQDVNRSDKVTGSLYFQGDFSKTIEYIEKLNESTPQYNLLWSNCVQHSTKALQCSNPIFRRTHSLIPNIAFNKASVVYSLLNIRYTYATID